MSYFPLIKKLKRFHLRFVRKWILKTCSERLQKVLWDLKHNKMWINFPLLIVAMQQNMLKIDASLQFILILLPFYTPSLTGCKEKQMVLNSQQTFNLNNASEKKNCLPDNSIWKYVHPDMDPKQSFFRWS